MQMSNNLRRKAASDGRIRGKHSGFTYEKLMRPGALTVSIMRPVFSSPEEKAPSVTLTRGSAELPAFSMFRKATVLAGCALVVMASFMFTLSVLDKGFLATCSSLLNFVNP